MSVTFEKQEDENYHVSNSFQIYSSNFAWINCLAVLLIAGCSGRDDGEGASLVNLSLHSAYSDSHRGKKFKKIEMFVKIMFI